MDKLNREALLQGLQGDDELSIGRRAIDWAEQALSGDTFVTSPFLDPLQQQVVRSVFRRIDAVSYETFGGYRKAERKRIVVFPHYALVDSLEQPIAVLHVQSSDGERIGHRDALGTFIGSGIERDRIGDIISTDDGCQVIVAREVKHMLLTEVDRVGRSSVHLVEIDAEQIEGAYDRVKHIRTTVASLRLDAVASSGFGDSRTKMSRHIRDDRVKLNWKKTTNAATEVEPGDVISVRGRGRVTLKEITGTTRKGRIGIVLERYL